jgi:hypothetical protein
MRQSAEPWLGRARASARQESSGGMYDRSLADAERLRHPVIEGLSLPDSCPSARGLEHPFATLSKLGRAAWSGSFLSAEMGC